MTILELVVKSCNELIAAGVKPNVIKMSNATLLGLRVQEKIPTNMLLTNIEMSFGNLKIVGDNDIPVNEIYVLDDTVPPVKQ